MGLKANGKIRIRLRRFLNVICIHSLKFSKARNIYLLPPTTSIIATHKFKLFIFLLCLIPIGPISVILRNHLFLKFIFYFFPFFFIFFYCEWEWRQGVCYGGNLCQRSLVVGLIGIQSILSTVKFCWPAFTNIFSPDVPAVNTTEYNCHMGECFHGKTHSRNSEK